MKTYLMRLTLLLIVLLPAAGELNVLQARAISSDFPSAEFGWSGASSFIGCTEDAGPWQAMASENLGPLDENYYGPEALTDNDFTTCWAVKGGVEAWFELTPPGQRGLFRTLSIVNGYTKSEERWRQNGRVKELLLSINEKPLAKVRLLDTPSSQAIDFPNRVELKSTDRLRWTILSVYPGDTFDDVCISEIQVNTLH